MSIRRTANSLSNIPSESETDNTYKYTENNTESLQGGTSVESNTNWWYTKKLLQIQESPSSDFSAEQRPNLSVKTQQNFSEVFSSEQTQTEIESFWLQHQQRIEAANQLLRKQEQKRKQTDTTIESTLYWISTWWYSFEKNSTDTYNIKKATSTTSCKTRIFHSYTLRLSCYYRKTETSNH